MADKDTNVPCKTDYISREAAIETVKFYEAECDPIPRAIDSLEQVPAADVRPVVHAHWNLVGKQMVINLANAREQYSELGYPHRNILQVQCDKCRLITMVDESIRYDYCPHCGADMRGVQSNG